MSSIYSLFVQTVDGITWKPGSTHGKKPNLYVAIHQDSAKVQRTRTVNRELAPTWDHTAKISDSSTAISLRIYHDSSIPFAPDKCLGTVDTDLSTLVKLCSSDGDAHAVRLELKGVDGKLKGRPVGTISVRLARGDEAVADQVVEPTKKDAERIGLPATTSTVMKTGGRVEQAASASGWGSVLGSVVSKLEIIVCVGDEVATIHPYVNIAWKVLTSVYKAVKNQQDTDDKLLKLVETMDEVYSFVKDVKFLREKIKSLEDKSSAIFKQTFECALFIQEYTGHGFWDRTVRNTWMNTDQKIDNLCETLLQLRDSFDGRLAVQSLFISTKVLETVESLDQTDTLKRLNPVDMNASLRTPCLPGTRKEILDSIEGRLSVPSDAGNVLWLSGVAGSGKSTISTTVSEIYRTAHRLGAFLFFDRNDQSRSHPSAVIRTMAYSLGLFEPHIGSAISAAVKADPGVVNAPLATQFKQLLLGPLRSAEGYLPGPILIILDALDECGDRQSRAPLLSLLANDVPKLPSLFRVLITSRREPDIADTFRSRFVEMNLETGLDTPSSTRDVELFLRHELSRIQHNSSLSPLWPGEKEIQTLVALSGGLFIWAATAIRFMDDYSPDNQLKILLIQDYTQGFSLDVLYDVALQSAAPWTTNRKFTKDARAVLGCVVVGREPMTDGTIDMLLSGTTKSGDVLKFLGCVIEWSPGDRARTLHASFTDYLTDPRRSGGKPWAINPKTDHYALAVGCLRILRRELRFNICGLEDSHRRNADVADMADRVAKLISPQLSYASCFWYNHIEETPFDQFIGQEVGKFLQDLFLYWLEVLSLLGRIPIAIAALRVAAHCTKGQQSDLEDFIADTIRFMAAFAPAIAQSAPHIYISAIPFAPRGSKIAKQFATWIPATLQAQSSMEGDWPSIQQILRGHTENVLSVHFSRDGSRIASGSQDGTVRVWDVQTGALVIEPLKAHNDSVNSVKFSLDGARIASGSDDKTVRVWAAATGALVAGPLEHTASVISVDFALDGARIVSGAQDNTVRLWDHRAGILVAGPFEGYGSVQFSPDGRRIACGSRDHTVCLWDAQTGTIAAGPFEGHTGAVTCVKFARNGAKIASGSDDGTVRVWDAQTGALVAGPFVATNPVNCVVLSPDGAQIVCSDDRLVRIWGTRTGELIGILEGHFDSVTSVDFSPDGMQITSGSADFTVRVWDARSGTSLGTPFNGQPYPVFSVHFSSDGTRIASGSDEVFIWDVQTGALVVGPIHAGVVWTVNFSLDSARLASGGEDKTVSVWDAQNGTLVAGPFTGHTDTIQSVQFSPDGTRILSASRDATIRVWDALTGTTVAGPFNGHSILTSAQFSPDGKRIACASQDCKVYVWDIPTGALASEPIDAQYGQMDPWVNSVHFSPDGTRIAGACGDSTVRVWDAETGILVAGPFKGHTNRLACVQFSPDGARIVSGALDNTLRVWDSQTGALVAGPFGGHTNWVLSVCFSPDGKHVASASVDASIRVWEINPSVEGPLGGYIREEDGWVLDSVGNLMFWVPPWIRDGLYHPRNALVICRQGTTKLDFSRFVHGTEWPKCINPEFRDTKFDTD